MNIPGYNLTDVIARSRQTIVTRGFRVSDGRPVVVKESVRARGALARRRRTAFEHRLLAKLRGPGVIEVLDQVDDGSSSALVLEDFGGASLALSTGQRLSTSEFLDVALQTSRALQRVHGLGVIHKDIKPHNVLRSSKTGEVKLIDFQLATELSRETPDIDTANILEGSLPYISPEQTGRMNRSVDYRSDYYSLGVTLFQWATGQLPFQATDAMGWVHAHISKAPPLASEIAPSVPVMVSRIIDRLLRKDPDERYQSLSGLIEDIERCRERWNRHGDIPEFALGESDVSERFQLVQRLVGREAEVERLRASFEAASEGESSLLLVSGPAGIGKSSLIREIHKPITARRGSFVSGKFDQLDRNVPYSALVQAASQLVQGLLIATDEELAQWKTRILAALGSNVAVMVDLVPELARVVGETEVVASLNATEAQNRFNRAFADFVRLFATRERPLVIFLDDLQWADASTPALLADLLLRQNVHHLLVIGAYRDDEIEEGHLLPRVVKEIRAGRPQALAEVSVCALDVVGVRALVAESLRQPTATVEPLAALVHQRTGGNPFFATELLEELYRTGAIDFDTGRRAWGFDLSRAEQVSITDNVVQLLISRLQSLSPSSAKVLSVAACVGNVVDSSTIGQLVDLPASEVARELWTLASAGFIVPIGDAYRLAQSPADAAAETVTARYRFRHDRVQQAAYALIAGEDRAAVHLRIGRRLSQNLDGAALEAQIFEVVNHLDLGRSLIVSVDERIWLQELNLRAAERAVRSTAYAIAVKYLEIAESLLTANEWSERPQAHFRVELRRVEAVLMAGDPERAKALNARLAQQAPDKLSRVSVWLLEARILESMADFVASVAAARNGLALLDIVLPTEMPDIEQGIGAGIGRMQEHLSKTTIEDLLKLPDLEDPEKLVAMNLLFQVIPAAIQTCPPLFILAELTMFDLMVEHGLTGFSAKNLVDCGIIQGGILGNYDAAYRLGKLAFEVLRRFDARRVASSVHFVFGAYISSWRVPHAEALAAFDECYRVGMETGDIQHMGFATALKLHRLLHVGYELPALREELTTGIAFLERAHLSSQRTAVILVERALARLCDLDTAPQQAAQADDEATARVEATRNPQWIYAYGEAQMVVSLLLGDFAAADRWRRFAEPQVGSATSLISVPEFHLCDALLATRYGWAEADAKERGERLEKARKVREELKKWAENCADNFSHKYHLVAAEIARLEQEPMEVVLRHYEGAAATPQGAYGHMRALALEFQAYYWQERQNTVFSRALLRDARELYAAWGAHAKVGLLDRQAPPVEGFDIESITVSDEQTTTSHSDVLSGEAVVRSALDLESVLKATRAVASEVHLDRLYASLMSTMLENAAAQDGCLILVDDATGKLVVEARATTSARLVEVAPVPVESAPGLCLDVVRYVVRNQKPLVIDDARVHSLFRANAYIIENAIKSVLCLPVRYQGKLLAVFYAENNAATYAFPPHRVATLHMIAVQAAVSLVNARLYQSLEQKVEERTRELATRNRKIVAMLDGMDQGVFGIDQELRVLPRYSRQVPELLGGDEVVGREFVPLLFAGSDLSQDALARMESALLFSYGYPLEFAAVNAEHFPSKFARRDRAGGLRQFEVDWKPVPDESGEVQEFLVVVRDVTEIQAYREAQVQRAWETEVVERILAVGVEEFRSFCDSARVRLRDCRRALGVARPLGQDVVSALFRNLHTVKGNARSIGLKRLVGETHAAEDLFTRAEAMEAPKLSDPERLDAAIVALEASLAQHEDVGQAKLERLWKAGYSRMENAFAEIEAALETERLGASGPANALREVEQAVRRMRGVPLVELVTQTARSFASIASELGKPVPTLDWAGEATLLTEDWGRVMKDVLTHAFRNCLDHGLEASEERLAAGKPERGRIRVTAEDAADGLRIRLSDDGRGLAVAELRDRTGADSDEALADRVFSCGVSTKAAVTRISGRGVGMAAMRSFVAERGGAVALVFTGAEQRGYRPFELVFELPAEARLG